MTQENLNNQEEKAERKTRRTNRTTRRTTKAETKSNESAKTVAKSEVKEKNNVIPIEKGKKVIEEKKKVDQLSLFGGVTQ